VEVRLRFWPLLKGRFEASELVLERPRFNLIKQPDGRFNYADIADKRASSRRAAPARKHPERSPQSATVPWLLPANVTIRNGQLHLIAQGEQPLTLDGVRLTLRNAASGMPFSFRAGFEYPGLKTVSLAGELIYHEEKAVLELKDNRLQILDLTLPLEGSISGVSAAPRLNLRLGGENLDARPIFQILAAFGLAPTDADVSGPMALSMRLTGPAMQWLAEARGVFRDIKVDGKRAFRGTLRGEVAIGLPAGAGHASKRLQGTGKLAARDGELTNVDLIRKIERVTGMIGLSKEERRQATTFETLEADFTLAGGAADFSRLYLVNPQLEVTGGGSMTIERPVLDLAIRTALSARASSRAGAGRMAAFLRDRQGRVVVPLKVAGPVENPSVELNSDRLAENGMPEAAEKRFSSFFRLLFRSR
jgi:uncharacterized protein involved in outer membrane biogenesis